MSRETQPAFKPFLVLLVGPLRLYWLDGRISAQRRHLNNNNNNSNAAQCAESEIRVPVESAGVGSTIGRMV